MKTYLTLLMAVAFCFVGISARADQNAEKKAAAAAQEWLKLVDTGKYDESWDLSSTLFRNAGPKERWEQALNGVRKPLGNVLSRKLKSKEYTTTLPGAPDGQYVVLQYDTSFEKKKKALETVTPMLDSDGKWRVSGYYIR